MKKIIIYIICFCLLPFAKIFGQKADSSSFYFFHSQDSTNFIGDSLISDTSGGKNQKNWGHEISRLFMVPPKTSSGGDDDYKYNRSSYFSNYNGKIIRKISIVQLEVFGSSVIDTNAQPHLWIEKLGNSLHISTNKSSIRNYLFINENERIDAYILANNERILRELPSVQDARIYVVPLKNNSDSVDINILTKDVWPLGLGVEILDIGYGNLGVWNNNVLGLGHILGYTGYYNFDKEPKYGYMTRYRIPNIGNMFISLDLSHYDKWNYMANKVYLSRNIITPVVRLGGGIGYEKVDQILNIETYDSIIKDAKANFEYYDFWAGYAFPLSKMVNFKMKKSIFFSVREQIYHYFDRPQVEQDYLYYFQQRKVFLSSVGYTLQGYQNTRLIYGFGDTEDLPYGAMIKLTGGYEWGEYFNRYYFGATFTYSKIMEKLGYLSTSVDFGGFIKNWAEQGVFSYNLLHISPLIGNGKHLFRNFTRVNYEQGYNRYRDEFIEIGKDYGVRGLDYFNLKGDRRFYVNSEFVYYSPLHFYSFRFVFFTFIDAGVINFEKETLFKNTPYSSLGLGIRIRNEKLVFNTLQLRFCYFPGSGNIPLSDKQIYDMSGVPKYRMPDFTKQRPEIINY